jgi:hypothetical protein
MSYMSSAAPQQGRRAQLPKARNETRCDMQYAIPGVFRITGCCRATSPSPQPQTADSDSAADHRPRPSLPSTKCLSSSRRRTGAEDQSSALSHALQSIPGLGLST